MKDKIGHILKADITVKSLSILVTAFMLLTAVPGLVNAVKATDDGNRITIEKQFSFSAPTIEPDGEFVKIQMKGAESTTNDEGAPQLPALYYRAEIPFGSTDVAVTFSHSSDQSTVVDGKITPYPIPKPLMPDRNYPLAKILLRLYSKLAPNAGLQTPETIFDDIARVNEKIYGQHISYGAPFSSSIAVGRNDNNELATFVVLSISPFTLTDVADGEGSYFTDATVQITYTKPVSSTGALPEVEQYDLLILAPSLYIKPLQPLVAHKENKDLANLKVKLVNLDEIYSETYFPSSEKYSRDNQEKIKYFIYNAVLEWGVTSVMAVGSWRTFLGLNLHAMTFPIRSSHNNDGGDPYYTTDQYFSSFLKYDPVAGYVFDDWDSNGNNRFGEWDTVGYDTYEPYPDVTFGRLACTNTIEVKNVVDKIIFYETHYSLNEPWFNRILTVTGDGFTDRNDLPVAWDTNVNTPDGEYTIYAISSVGALFGPQDQIHVTVDHSAKSKVEFLEDDHLKIEPLDPEQPEIYPGKPVAEIIVPGIDGCVLGNTDVGPYVPTNAYDGANFATVSYVAGVLQIRSKSYDPREMGMNPSMTKLKVWVNNSDGVTKLGPVTLDSTEYYDGEVEVAHALAGIPSTFEKLKDWTSNGNFIRMSDVLTDFSNGSGFVYYSGHSSCMAWGDHFPGIPGGRANAMVNGFATINMHYGLERYQAKQGDPLFPIDQLTNGYKLPVLFLSGCHSGQFDTSLASMLSDPNNVLSGYGYRYGTWCPEGMAWWAVRVPQGGSIATFGNTALGYGVPGAGAPNGVTGFMFGHAIEKYFAEHIDTLGEIHLQALNDYADAFHFNTDAPDKVDRKTWEEFDLLGDPTLKIGGYPPKTGSLSSGSDDGQLVTIDTATKQSSAEMKSSGNPVAVAPLTSDIFKVTSNPKNDTNPMGIASTPDGKFVVSYTAEELTSSKTNPGFSYGGGSYWGNATFGGPLSAGPTNIFNWWTWDDVNEKWVQNFISGMYDTTFHPWLLMPDIMDPSTWALAQYWGYGNHPGRWGSAVTAYTDNSTNPPTTTYGGVWSCTNGVLAAWYHDNNDDFVASGAGTDYSHFNSGCDQGTNWHYYVFEKLSTGTVYLVRAQSSGAFQTTTFSGRQPDVAVANDWSYIVSENGASIQCRRSNDNGATWTPVTVTATGSDPELVIAANGNVECYFIQSGKIYKSVSADHGTTWGAATLILDQPVDTTQESPYQVTSEGLVFAKNDGDLYMTYFIPTKIVLIGAIELANNGKTVKTTVYHAGSVYAEKMDWTIAIEGDSPLGRFLGTQPGQPIYELLKGRVMRGSASGQIALSPGESEEISSNSVFGFGWVLVRVTVTVGDPTIVAEKTEDGFLLGGRLLLFYGEE